MSKITSAPSNHDRGYLKGPLKFPFWPVSQPLSVVCKACRDTITLSHTEMDLHLQRCRALNPEAPQGIVSDMDRLSIEARAVRKRISERLVLITNTKEKAQLLVDEVTKQELQNDKDQLYVDHLDAMIAELRQSMPRPTPPVRMGRCAVDCKKRRFGSRDEANKGRKVAGTRMRAYYSWPCKCWHLTKNFNDR